MSGARDLTADVDIDAAGLLAEVWKKKLLVLGLTLATGIALAFGMSQMKPRYEAGARVLIEKRESVFTRQSSGDFTLEGSQFDEQAIGSQVQVLASDDIALKVISQLDLARLEEFGGPGTPSWFDGLLMTVGLKGQPGPATADGLTLKAFKRHLNVYAAEKSRVLVVEFWSHDPELAQRVPNAIVDEYLEITKQAKLEANTEATQWLGPEIDDLRNKVREAEAKVAEFRASSDISIGNNNALLATQQLSEVSSEMSRLRGERSAAEARAASIRAALGNGASLDTVPEVMASPLIQRLRERQVALQSEISELSTTLLPNHPRIRALRSQLADFDAQIRAEARNILKGLENNADVVAKQETALLREVDRLKAEAARVSEAEVELRALEREAAAQRELLQSYLTQYREAASRQSREYLPVDARVISRAVLPAEPYFPKTTPIAAAGMVSMFVLSIVAILAWALMTGRAFRTVGRLAPEMMPERVDLPVPAAAAARRDVAARREPVAAPAREPAPAAPIADQAAETVPPDTGKPVVEPAAPDGPPAPPARERTKREYAVRPGAEPPLVFEKPSMSYIHFDEDQAAGLPHHASADAGRDPAGESGIGGGGERPTAAAGNVPAAANDAEGEEHAGSSPVGLPEVAAPSLDSEPLPGADDAPPHPEAFDFGLTCQAIENLERSRIAIISPAGDPGSAAAWLLARRLATGGGSVAVVDLTGSGVTSLEMLGGQARLPGLREFLAGKIRFGDAVHRDRLTSAHVIPCGSLEDDAAIDLARLAEVVAAVADGYDYEIYDCGYAGAEALHLVADQDTIVVVSAAGARPGEAAEMAQTVFEAGFTETIMVDLDAGQDDAARAEASSA